MKIMRKINIRSGSVSWLASRFVSSPVDRGRFACLAWLEGFYWSQSLTVDKSIGWSISSTLFDSRSWSRDK